MITHETKEFIKQACTRMMGTMVYIPMLTEEQGQRILELIGQAEDIINE